MIEPVGVNARNEQTRRVTAQGQNGLAAGCDLDNRADQPAYGRGVTADDELAEAIRDRPRWRPAGERSAVFEPAGAIAHIKVARVVQPVRASERYMISIIQSGRATHARPAGTAIEAIRWAEGTRLPAADA